MPLVREPSQRTKAWVRWNYGQNSSKNSLATVAATEIIHLGGSRVGTPEPSPCRPGTAQELQRPCTTWFPAPYAPAPEPPIGISRSKTDPQELFSPIPTPSSFETMSEQYSPAPLSLPSEKLSSPPSATSTAFSKMSSPPPYSNGSTTSVSSGSARQLRRTQSAADIQKRARTRKALPPRPMETTDESESDAQESSSEAKHVGQLMKEGARVTQWFPLPPMTSPPPSRPLPTIGTTSPTSPDRPSEAPKPVKKDVETAKPEFPPRKSSLRHSPQERLWLHRNYRGEATFLKAWGLNIEKADDRDEGITIMKELMASEEEKRKSKKAEKAKELGLPEGGLQIIIEEEKASLSEPDKPSPRMIEHSSHHLRPQGLKVPPRSHPSPTHLRSESESSVLGAYLDVRMSRFD
ncbi:hypothetical protein JX265_005525 [Neoarthrinium moseri]|uniref:Uncharacterized protein n=1 Tax=Neoarthrinium moseri TaxID=1658444 RepID=A0A9Q0ARE3_9PEZI|nr:uncharacterized protein JN550_012665 [Neoarthrinium moseri]KAI1847415.1 hypothetical protein JX266_006640 [Neoarthrinium moseri]KAI1858455.1 hypothetical protein JN550_012665 [Neoarthrinium moseri]KAI1872645.1 hypothetical protein JX265_005525 [Neoarthrinium moseri]